MYHGVVHVSWSSAYCKCVINTVELAKKTKKILVFYITHTIPKLYTRYFESKHYILRLKLSS